MTVSGTSGTNSATFSSKEVGPFTRTVNMTLPNGSTVTYVADSTRMVNPNDNSTKNIADVSGNSPLLTAEGYKFDEGHGIGVLPFCDQYRRNVTFQVKVVTPTPPTTPTPPVTSKVPAAPKAPGQVLSAVKALPNTGPEAGLQLVLAGLVPAGMLIRRFKV
jgi:hypothetical protein